VKFCKNSGNSFRENFGFSKIFVFTKYFVFTKISQKYINNTFRFSSALKIMTNRKIFIKNKNFTPQKNGEGRRKQGRRITTSMMAALTPDGSSWGGRWRTAQSP
jgi:hypothetical protein